MSAVKADSDNVRLAALEYYRKADKQLRRTIDRELVHQRRMDWAWLLAEVFGQLLAAGLVLFIFVVAVDLVRSDHPIPGTIVGVADISAVVWSLRRRSNNDNTQGSSP